MHPHAFDLGAWAGGLAKTVAAACLIGGGTMVLNTARENASQDQRLIQVERSLSAVEHLSDKLDKTNEKLDQLIGKTHNGR